MDGSTGKAGVEGDGIVRRGVRDRLAQGDYAAVIGIGYGERGRVCRRDADGAEDQRQGNKQPHKLDPQNGNVFHSSLRVEVNLQRSPRRALRVKSGDAIRDETR